MKIGTPSAPRKPRRRQRPRQPEPAGLDQVSGADGGAEAPPLLDDIRGYAHDPLAFVEHAFPWGTGALAGEDGPDDWQRALLAEVRDALAAGESRLRFAVASGHGVGKTALTAWLILWFLSTRDHPQVVATANTAAQLRDKTWRELAKWHRLSAVRDWFEWTQTRLALRASPETWFAAAVPWSRDRPESFAGTHDRHVCMVFDEASAIADDIWDVAEGAMASPGAMWFAFGNPTRASGRFRECFHRFRHRWRTRKVDSRTARKADRREIAHWVEDYGEDSDFVRVRVRGEFPRAGFNQFISAALVAEASGRAPVHAAAHPLVMGVDVARFGDDASVILARHGPEIVHLAHYRGVDTMRLAGFVAEAARRLRPDAVLVDGAGVGAGVVDRLRALGLRVDDVNAGARAREPGRFANLRAEMWSAARDWLKAGGCLPADARTLADDLAAPEYGFDEKGRLRLEGKEEMKARGIASPDFGDALALTFARPVRLSEWDRARPRTARDDWDPFAGPRPPSRFRAGW